jgi:uridylate kinase
MEPETARPPKPRPGTVQYRRVLLKLSGEVFGGAAGQGFDYDVIRGIADQIHEVRELDVAVGLVVGAGNIFRGARSAPPGMERISADYMGMLGTIINAICLQSILETKGLSTRVMTAIEIRAIAEPYIKRRAERHLDKGRVVIFAGGTGHPFFTTDTAAALRASEIGAEVLIKGTKVDGVYDKDPELHKDAARFTELTFQEVLQKELRIMDSTAVAFCKDNMIPILVMNIEKRGTLFDAVRGEPVGTLVK